MHGQLISTETMEKKVIPLYQPRSEIQVKLRMITGALPLQSVTCTEELNFDIL